MNIHEYQAKAVLREFGAPVPRGIPAFSPEEAVKAANENGIPVELIDRDINITLKRSWANLGLWKRSMLLSSLMVGCGGGGGVAGAGGRAGAEALPKRLGAGCWIPAGAGEKPVDGRAGA